MTVSTVAFLGTLRDLHSSLPAFDWGHLRGLVANKQPDFLCVEVGKLGWETGDLESATVESSQVLVPLTRTSDITLIPLGAGGRGWVDSGLAPPRRGWFANQRRLAVAALGSLTVRLMSLAGGAYAIDSPLVDHLCALLCTGQVLLADSDERAAWEARNHEIADGVLWAARRDPGRRILVAVDCRRKHGLYRLLRGEPGLSLVALREL